MTGRRREGEERHWATIALERRALADLVATLTPQQWATPSLCPAWTVHGVVAHLVSVHEADRRQLAGAVVRGRALPPRVVRALAAGLDGWSGADLADGLRRHAGSRFHPPGLGARSALTDVMVHRVDVAVPLGLPVDRPAAHWTPVLDFLLSGLPMLGSIRGGRPRLRYRATDVDWHGGRSGRGGPGTEVSGTAAALATTIAGRPALVHELDGPGVAALRAWVGAGAAS